MTDTSVPAAARAVIDEVRGILAADGYDLTARLVGPATVDLQVRAGGDACSDCLVPKPVMTEIIQARLAGTNVKIRNLMYPGEPAGTGPDSAGRSEGERSS